MLRGLLARVVNAWNYSQREEIEDQRVSRTQRKRPREREAMDEGPETRAPRKPLNCDAEGDALQPVRQTSSPAGSSVAVESESSGRLRLVGAPVASSWELPLRRHGRDRNAGMGWGTPQSLTPVSHPKAPPDAARRTHSAEPLGKRVGALSYESSDDDNSAGPPARESTQQGRPFKYEPGVAGAQRPILKRQGAGGSPIHRGELEGRAATVTFAESDAEEEEGAYPNRPSASVELSPLSTRGEEEEDAVGDQILEEHLAAMRAQDVAIRASYDDVLRSVVSDIVREEAHRQLRFSWGTTFGLIRDAVKKIVVQIVPPSVGVLRALKSGSAFHIPIQLDAVDREALAGLKSGNPEEVVVKGRQGDITKRHLLSCEDRSWLSDPIINEYYALIEARSGGSVVVINSFWYSKLTTIPSADRRYEQMARWTRKLKVFASDKVLIVINTGNHWTLAVMNNKKRRFEYYDSLGGNGERVLSDIRDYFARDAAAKGEGPTDLRQWPSHVPLQRQVMQKNGYDCGVFCTQFGLYVASDLPFTFTQTDMQYLRQLIQLEILSGKLLNRL